MAKDKLITIRIEDLKREAFKNWANSKDLDVSAFLYDVIDACLDGRIDERMISSSRLDNRRENLPNDRIDIIEKKLANLTEQLEACIDKKIDERLASLDSQLDAYCQEIDKKIDERLAKYENEIESLRAEFNRSRVANFSNEIKQEANSIEESINNASAAKISPVLNSVDRSKAVTDEEVDRTNTETTPPTSEIKPTEPLKEFEPTTSTDTQLLEKGLTDKELAEIIGCGHNTVYRWRKNKSSPSEKYVKPMSQWEVRGDRWFSKKV